FCYSSSSVLLRDLHSFPTRRSSDLTFAIFFSRQGLIFPLFVLSISTLDFSSELMLLLLHIMNTETPYVNLFLCGNLNNNIGYFRSEEHTSELQSRFDLVCRLLLEKKKTIMRL